MLQNLIERAASLVFPAECEACREPCSQRQAGVCARCASKIRMLEAPHCVSCGRTLKNGGPRCAHCRDAAFHFDRAYACTLYEGGTKELLHAFKFRNRKMLKSFFVKTMHGFFEKHLRNERFDLAVSVPMDAERERERGFNQSRLLSAGLAGRLGIGEASNRLRCIRKNAPQSLLAKAGRRSNVKGSFAVKPGGCFLAKRVLLVDDILTTGHTASECARTLKAAGAAAVTVLTFARGA